MRIDFDYNYPEVSFCPKCFNEYSVRTYENKVLLICEKCGHIGSE